MQANKTYEPGAVVTALPPKAARVAPMIERVAKAQFFVWRGVMIEKGHPPTDILWSWETTDEATRDYWRAVARAATAAMRQPTMAMVNASIPYEMPWKPSGEGCAAAWCAMIDAALAEGD